MPALNGIILDKYNVEQRYIANGNNSSPKTTRFAHLNINDSFKTNTFDGLLASFKTPCNSLYSIYKSHHIKPVSTSLQSRFKTLSPDKLAKKPQPTKFIHTMKAISHCPYKQPSRRGILLL